MVGLLCWAVFRQVNSYMQSIRHDLAHLSLQKPHEFSRLQPSGIHCINPEQSDLFPWKVIVRSMALVYSINEEYTKA